MESFKENKDKEEKANKVETTEESDESELENEESTTDDINLPDELISKKIAAIESHKRSRSLFIVCILGIASTVITAIFVSISAWSGAATACIFSGVFAMLGVKAIKDYKYLENAYGLRKKK